MSNSNNNNNWGSYLFISGLIAGAAAGYYLNTQHGRKVRQAIAERSQELGNEIVNKTQQVASNVKDNTQSILTAAGETVSAVKEQVLNTAQNVVTMTEKKTETFQDGIKKAKEELANSRS